MYFFCTSIDRRGLLQDGDSRELGAIRLALYTRKEQPLSLIFKDNGLLMRIKSYLRPIKRDLITTRIALKP